jgi:hypothetical protein
LTAFAPNACVPVDDIAVFKGLVSILQGRETLDKLPE